MHFLAYRIHFPAVSINVLNDLCHLSLLEQVYLHLADMSGQADTREKVDSRLDNLQKAADALDLAITRLTPEHEIKVPLL